jgi:hypothetical protein
MSTNAPNTLTGSPSFTFTAATTGTTTGNIVLNTGSAFQPYTYEKTVSIPEEVTSETEAIILDAFRAFANMGIVKEQTHWVAYNSLTAYGHTHSFLNNATIGMATGGVTTSNLVLGGHNHDYSQALIPQYSRGHSTMINYTMNKVLSWL